LDPSILSNLPAPLLQSILRDLLSLPFRWDPLAQNPQDLSIP
jgi:hypothetical protein